MKTNVFISMLLLSVLFACHRLDNPVADTEVARVKVAAVSHEKMGFPVRTSGLVVSAKEVKLSFKTGGIISSIYADEGASVKKGTLLATLNLSEIEAQVTQAKLGYDKAMRDYTRAKNLFADTVVTLEQLQNAETAMNVAKANLGMAAFNLNHSRIVAPDDGVILKRLAETNEVIAQGYPVFLFGSSGKYWKIRAGITDRDFVHILPGDSATVVLDAYPGEHFTAIVGQVGEAANPLTGTYAIELDLLPVKRRLASGFVANLVISPSKTEFYYRIPVEAIVEAEGYTGYVFVVTDSSTVSKVTVRIAGIFETMAAVSGDLDEVKDVVTEGAAYISDGEKVAVVK